MDDRKSTEDNASNKLDDTEESSTNKEITEPIPSNNDSTPKEDNNSLTNRIEVIEYMIKVDKMDCKKVKMPIKLPREPELQVRDCEIEVVGDDTNMRKEQHIDCECEPNVAGAAVPTVISFNTSPSKEGRSDFCAASDNKISIGKAELSANNIDDDKLHEQVGIRKSSSEINVFSQKSKRNESIISTDLLKSKVRHQSALVKKCINLTRTKKSLKMPEISIPKLKSRDNLSTENAKRNSERSLNSNINTHRSNVKSTLKYAELISKPKTATMSSDSKTFCKRPSMIPKPSRPNSSNQRMTEYSNTNIDKRDKINQSSVSRLKYSNENLLSNTIIDAGMTGKTISTRMVGLQERLKATTSLLRKKMESDSNNKAEAKNKKIPTAHLQTPNIRVKSSSDTLRDLYRNIYQMKETALNLSSTTALRNQKEYVEKLLNNISEIQNIADKLSENDKVSSSREPRNRDNNKPSCSSKDATIQSNKVKDNKIYIKFFQSKEKQPDKKRQRSASPQLADCTQNDLPGPSLIPASTNIEPRVEEQAIGDKNLMEKDSMDGVFIPSLEPPSHIEEEDETNGLDITITFPEFNQLLSEQDESHLSVRLSDISAEALRKLKRCPKDFTLRMDFVQGKVLFQSGKAPANNFLISPDLKFVENLMEEKKSDIISIKPATECSFASQLISVENIKDCAASYKSLKSTDSELFNVVNLPLLFRNPSLNPVTRSCITFKNDNIISMAILARQFFKSMPQIPSLTNIYEDKFLENFNKAAFQIQDKKRRNRPNLKRAITSSSLQ